MRQQQGAVLIIGLVMLATLTLMGVTALQTGVLEEKLSGNLIDQHRAFHASESALAEAESWLYEQSSEPDVANSCNTPPCVQVWETNTLDATNTGSEDWWRSNWWTTNAIEASSLHGLSENPRYIMELKDYLPDDKDPDTRARRVGRVLYLISAEAVGKGTATKSVLQSSFSSRFN